MNLNNKNFFLKAIGFFILLFIVLLNIPIVRAAPPEIFTTLQEIQTQTGLAGGETGAGPSAVIGRIIFGILTAMGVIFLILMVYAGFRWMTAGGNEETIKKAQALISRAVIGFIIVLSAYSITWFVFDKLLKATGVKT
jgi:hypothetical protein